jgi:cell division protein FtsN
MSKDYKTPPKAAPRKKGHPLLTGLLIGLFAGVTAAVGVALYINKAPSPFVERDKPPEAAPEQAANAATQGVAPETAAPAIDKPGKAPHAKPRFDFYNILPGSEEPITEQDIKNQAQQPANAKEAYYLQAGAFQSGADADNLKAKLALLGVEAVIQTAELPGKGLWHRVRTGPYATVEEAGKARAMLAQNKVETTLIKVKDAPQ